MNREIILNQFAKAGLKTVVAGNGLEGVEVFRNRAQNASHGKPFDLVFMDIQMPVMDGFEAAAEIMKMNTGTPIIAMTANAAGADRENYAKSGMPDCIRKPFTSKELWTCLSKYLSPVNAAEGAPADAAANVPADVVTEDPPDESEEEFQKKLIQNFINENQNRYDEIAGAVESGDIKLARRLAHSLKSNAGYLGKTGLQKAAGVVENLLGENNDLDQEKLDTLKAELDQVLRGFAAFETAKSSRGPAARDNVNAEEKRVLLDKLEQLLERGNPECLSLIDGLRTMPGSEELTAHMEKFNFDEALEILGKLKPGWI
jgi:CheY-like chemotaxis protein